MMTLLSALTAVRDLHLLPLRHLGNVEVALWDYFYLSIPSNLVDLH